MTACTQSSKYRIVDCSRTNHINIQCTNDLKSYATSQQSCELLPVRTIPKNRRCHHVALRFPGGGAGDGRAIDGPRVQDISFFVACIYLIGTSGWWWNREQTHIYPTTTSFRCSTAHSWSDPAQILSARSSTWPITPKYCTCTVKFRVYAHPQQIGCVWGGGGYLLQIHAKVLEYMPMYHFVIQSAGQVFGYFGAI